MGKSVNGIPIVGDVVGKSVSFDPFVGFKVGKAVNIGAIELGIFVGARETEEIGLVG